jgi:N-acetylmuramic acid 6-phosphate etherase
MNRLQSSAFDGAWINYMATEEVDPRFADLDAWSLASAMEAMWEGQLAAVAAIGHALPAITAATEAAKAALGDHGRIVYVGAGTSARVAVQDGAELTPTFAWPSERVRFIVAGGDSAFVTSIEGAEDDVDDAVTQINAARLTQNDVVIAVAASGTTPFTVAALQQAGSFGAVTIGIANNPGTVLLASAKFPILIETGRELIAGSTRMKAGTAQKVVLNLISSGIMLRLGRVFRGMMVNMQPTNAKLKRRAEAMVAQIAQCDPSHAARSLEQAEGDIKMAGLLALGVDRVDAETILKNCDGNLRRVFAELTKDVNSHRGQHPKGAAVPKPGGAVEP